MVAVLNSLIELDERGVAWIVGANTKVVEVVLDKMAYGWSPDIRDWQEVNELAAQQPESPLRRRLREIKRERSSVL